MEYFKKNPGFIILFISSCCLHEKIIAQNLVDSIAATIIDNTWDDSTKVVKIYDWIGHNIQYSKNTYSRTDNTTWQSAENVLQTGKAVCIGYAHVFNEFCKKSGIESYVIEGFSKYSFSIQHAWNAVRIKDQWYLADITWDADNIQNGQPWAYFLISPEIFNDSHYPHDPVWQLTDNPVDFYYFKKKLALTTPSLPFSWKDTLTEWLKMPEDKKLVNSLHRSLAFNPDNAFVLKDLANFYYEKAITEYHKIEPQPILEEPDQVFEKRKEKTRIFFQLSKELFERVIELENESALTDSKINLLMIEDNLKSL